MEGPAGGKDPAATGKGTAAFPALLDGLVGEQATPAAGSAVDALITRDESLPAGQGRHSGGHAGGKFTELERLIARTGRTLPSDAGTQEADIVTVQTPKGNRALSEAGQVTQAVMPPIMAPSIQAVPGLTAVQPALVRANTQPADGNGELPRTVERPSAGISLSAIAGLPHTVDAFRVQVRGPAAVDVRAGRSVAPHAAVPTAMDPGIAIPEIAVPQAPNELEPVRHIPPAATSKLTAIPGASLPQKATTNDTPPIGPTPAMETTPETALPENALPEPNRLVPQSPPKTIRPITTTLPVVGEGTRPTGTTLPARVGRSPLANRERNQQPSAAGSKFTPMPRVVLEAPQSDGPAVVTEVLHAPELGGAPVIAPAAIPAVSAPTEVPPAQPLAPNVSAPSPSPAKESPAKEKETSPRPVSGELPVAGRLDGWSKSTDPVGTRTASPPAEAVAGISPRNGESAAAEGAKVRTLSIASPDRGEVAFAVELRPAEERPVPTERQTPQVVAAPVKAAAPEVVAFVERRSDRTAPLPQENSAAVAEISARGGETDHPATGEREKKQAAPERSPRPVPTVDVHSEGAAAVPELKVASHWTQSGALRQEGLAEPAASPDATPARPEEPAAARMDAKADVQPASAHEIKLEVSGGERRVEVRLSERGGEVRVAVRTPDSHLAGTLRESLPELTTRLAETGMRSEIWRPAGTPPGESRHAAETASGNLAQDAESQSRGNGGEPQGDAQQRQQRSFLEPKNDKEKGKDFAWLMSSLR